MLSFTYPPTQSKRDLSSLFWFLFVVLVLICAGLSFSGCISAEKCNKRYPPVISDSTRTMIRDSIVHHYHTEYQSYCDEDTFKVPCPDFTQSKTINHKTISISVKNGEAIIKCSEDSLKHIIDSLQKITIIKSTDDRTKVKTVTVFETHWYDTGSHWLNLFLLILIALVLLWGWLTKKIPF